MVQLPMEEPRSTAVAVVDESPASSILQSLFEENTDTTNKARWLGYRASYFTVREACKLADVTERTIRNWRKEPWFYDAEKKLPELRKHLGKDIAKLEFLRNFRLILEQDYKVLKKLIIDKELLEPSEVAYLNKIRAHYTPQQLQTMDGFFTEDPEGANLNFTKIVQSMNIERTVVRRDNGGMEVI